MAGHNFLAQILVRRTRLSFSANKLLKLSHVFFFAVKAFTQVLRNFLEICSGNSNIMHFVDSLLFNTSTFTKAKSSSYQRWSRGHKARGQGQGHKKNPRPRTAFPRTDTLEAKDRNARGQDQGPRTQAQVLYEKKKKVFTKIFQAISTKTRFPKNFSSAPQNFNNSKTSAVLEPRTGQFSRT